MTPTWYRAPSAPLQPTARHTAHPSRRPVAEQPRTHPAGIRPAPAACEPAQPAHQPSRAHPASAGIRTPTRAAANGPPGIPFFREKWEQGANNPLPTSPKTAQASANPTELQLFFPVLANLELHDACPPRNLIRQFPHRPKTAFLASASFPVRNISAPCAPHPAANRPASGTRAHPADNSDPARARRRSRIRALRACALSCALRVVVGQQGA